MTVMSRRRFGLLAGAGAIASTVFGRFAIAQGVRAARIVVIGGGAGGASLAGELKRRAPLLDVTLIEPNRTYTTPFGSNPALAGLRPLDGLVHGYGGLRRLGVRVVHDYAISVDTGQRLVRIRGTDVFAYDRLVVAPGIEVDYESVPGYAFQATLGRAPHAWTADPGGVAHLKRMLDALPEQGTVAMALPAEPARCPMAAYERACMIAHHLKGRRPRARLVVLDAGPPVPAHAALVAALETDYKGIVELVRSTPTDSVAVKRFDLRGRTLETQGGRKIGFDVANVIPRQRAASIAARIGVVDGDWCPVDPATFASTRASDVYVIGDAARAPDMPKTAFAANSQAKAVAAAILATLDGKARPEVHLPDTTWSLVAPGDAVKAGASYRLASGRLQPVAAFASMPGEDASLRAQNALEASGWYDAITEDMFGAAGQRAEPAGAPSPSPAAAAKSRSGRSRRARRARRRRTDGPAPAPGFQP